MTYFFVKLVRYTLLFWLPFYLKQPEGGGFSLANAALLSTIFDVGGIVGAIACGTAADR